MTKKNDLVSEACADLEKSATLKEIEDLKVKYFGKKGDYYTAVKKPRFATIR